VEYILIYLKNLLQAPFWIWYFWRSLKIADDCSGATVLFFAFGAFFACIGILGVLHSLLGVFLLGSSLYLFWGLFVFLYFKKRYDLDIFSKTPTKTISDI